MPVDSDDTLERNVRHFEKNCFLVVIAVVVVGHIIINITFWYLQFQIPIGDPIPSDYAFREYFRITDQYTEIVSHLRSKKVK